jgi:hypothetical protein
VARKGDTGKRYTLQCHGFALAHAMGAPTKVDPVVSNGSGGALPATCPGLRHACSTAPSAPGWRVTTREPIASSQSIAAEASR